MLAELARHQHAGTHEGTAQATVSTVSAAQIALAHRGCSHWLREEQDGTQRTKTRHKQGTNKAQTRKDKEERGTSTERRQCLVSTGGTYITGKYGYRAR